MYLLAHPLQLVIACILASCVLIQLPYFAGWSQRRGLWCCVLVFLGVGILGPTLCAAGHIVNLDEPTVIADAAAALHGQPLYTNPDGAEQYSLLYGPVSFWVYWPPMVAHFLDIRIYQLWVILPLLGAGLLLLKSARRAGDALGASLALLPYVTAVVLQSNHEWAMKGDAWMLLFLCIGLEAAAALNATWAVMVSATAGALLIDTKVTAVLLSSILVLVVGRRFGKWLGVACAALTGALAAAAFLLPGVSWRFYSLYLLSSAHHGIVPRLARNNVELLLFLGIPMLTVLGLQFTASPQETGRWLRKRVWLVLACAVAALAAVVTGAKYGAGPWHLVPVVPLMTWGTVALWRRQGLKWKERQPGVANALFGGVVAAQIVLAVAALWTSIRVHLKGLAEYNQVPQVLIEQDIVRIARDHPQVSIQMGYGGDRSFEITWERPILVLLGNRYILDASALNESEMAGKELPDTVVSELQKCKPQLYLIPRGDQPFIMQNVYHFYHNPAPRDLFPAAFRQAFAEHYQKIDSSRYFDLWRCTTPGKQAVAFQR
jgi:hypothetical protein